MGIVELVSDERPDLAWHFRVLSSAWERMKGLLGTSCDASPVLLLRCSSVHTFAMRYALDLAFVGKDGQVLLVLSGVEPNHVITRNDAFCVLERPASNDPWLQEGERMRVCSLTVDNGASERPNERIGYEY